MKYMILASINKKDLSSQVETKIVDGWKLQGGVSITHTGAGVILAQAIIKENE